MEPGILESDWKLLRELRPLALGRFCDRVLAEVRRLATDTSKSSHERYLALFKLLHERDEELADAFRFQFERRELDVKCNATVALSNASFLW